MAMENQVTRDELVCRRLFPDQPLRALHFPFPPHTINRDYIEQLPIVLPQLVKSRLDSVSQVTLKDMWIGRPAIMSTRWQHSVGVYNIGEIWLKSLYERKLIPDTNTVVRLGENTIRTIAGYALLLHDYGHLFFSHLLEEALRTINWVPSEKISPMLETIPLKRRIQNPQETDMALLDIMKKILAQEGASEPNVAIEHVLALIEGTSGIPWLQAIVNGPVDADKIDYIGRDHELLKTSGYSVGVRIQLAPISDGEMAGFMPWLADFLSDQYVNHSGFLCLPGRSALAAADMWRERIFLYDRFYLAPAIRAADRIVLEILQHFLIRCIISKGFAEQVTSEDHNGYHIAEVFEKNQIHTLVDQMELDTSPVDVRDLKYEASRRLLESMLSVFGKSKQRDFELLTFMKDKLIKWPQIDDQHKNLLESLYDCLKDLRDKRLDLKGFASNHIVQQPLQFPRELAGTVRELVRSLQNQHYRDVLIDVCVLPNALSAPLAEGPIGSDGTQRFMQLLVPKGDISKWGPGSSNLEPLTPNKVKELERPYGRVTMLSTHGESARSKYVFDRLVGAMRASGIPIEELET